LGFIVGSLSGGRFGAARLQRYTRARGFATFQTGGREPAAG
jgi:hypothetical protein